MATSATSDITLEQLMAAITAGAQNAENSAKAADLKAQATLAAVGNLENAVGVEIAAVKANLAQTSQDLKGMIDLQGAQLTEAFNRFSGIEAELMILKNNIDDSTSAGGSTRGGSSYYSSNGNAAKRSRSDDQGRSGAAADASSHWQRVAASSEPTNIGRLQGFPHCYGKTDLLEWATAALAFLPDTIKYTLQAGGSAKSVRVEFETTKACKDAIDCGKHKVITWTEPGNLTMVPVKLYLKFDSAAELRLMGGLLSVAWAVSERTFAALPDPPVVSLLTDRKAGKLMMKAGLRFHDLFFITMPSSSGPATIKKSANRVGYPSWLTVEISDAIVLAVQQDDSF